MNDDDDAVDQIEDLKSRAQDDKETAQSHDDPKKVDEIEQRRSARTSRSSAARTW